MFKMGWKFVFEYYILAYRLTQAVRIRQPKVLLLTVHPNLLAKAGHDRLLHDAGIDAKSIPEREFDQTLGW